MTHYQQYEQIIDQLCDQVANAQNALEAYKKTFSKLERKHAEARELLFVLPTCILPSCQLNSLLHALKVKDKEAFDILFHHTNRYPEKTPPLKPGPYELVNTGDPNLREGWRWTYLSYSPITLNRNIKVMNVWRHKKSAHLFDSAEEAEKDARLQNADEDFDALKRAKISSDFESII